MTCFRLWLGQVILVLEAFAPDGNHWLPWAVTTTAVCTLLTFGIVSAAYYQMFATMVVSDDTTTIIDLNHSYYPCDTARRCVPAGICGGVGALHSSRNHRLFGTAPRPATPAPGDNAGVAQQCVVCVRARCSLALIPNTRARRVCVCVFAHTRARACMCAMCAGLEARVQQGSLPAVGRSGPSCLSWLRVAVVFAAAGSVPFPRTVISLDNVKHR